MADPRKHDLILIVCGGRNFYEHDYIAKVLGRIHEKNRVAMIVHGDARGADRSAADWAILNGIPVKACPADWEKHGNRAGPIRNSEMLKYDIDGVVAFPGGRGTQDMVGKAEDAGLPVWKLSGQ